jgi:hypothetical protein
VVIGGVSCQGRYHEINQDSFICASVKNGYVLALSDGVGSKKFSQYGSKAICEILKIEFEKENLPLKQFNWVSFLKKCHKKWIEEVGEYEITQCYATMLVLLVQGNYLKAARLGDGFLSVLADDRVHILMDQKNDYFANETDCLMEIFDEDRLEILEIEFDKFSGAVACSDGIEIGVMRQEEISSFTRDFIEEYSKISVADGKQNIEGWVSTWPGADDKTIAYIIEEVKNSESAI